MSRSPLVGTQIRQSYVCVFLIKAVIAIEYYGSSFKNYIRSMQSLMKPWPLVLQTLTGKDATKQTGFGFFAAKKIAATPTDMFMIGNRLDLLLSSSTDIILPQLVEATKTVLYHLPDIYI
jgi:hypothetical protein